MPSIKKTVTLKIKAVITGTPSEQQNNLKKNNNHKQLQKKAAKNFEKSWDLEKKVRTLNKQIKIIIKE